MGQIGFRRFVGYNTNNEMELHFWDNEAVGEHGHGDFFEFAVCVRGKLKQIKNGTEQTIISTKDVVLLQPGERHSLCSVNKGKAKHINITAKTKVFYEICSIFKLSKEDVASLVRKITLSDVQYNYICHLANESLKINLDEEETAYELLIKNIIVNLLNLFLSKGLKRNNTIPDWFQMFIEKISNPEYFSYSIQDLYTVSGYSQPTISMYFRKYYQKSFVKYFMERKISYACGLLRNTNYLIIEIANMAGFSTLSHFNKTFKDMVGVSPSHYRKVVGFALQEES